MAKCKIRDWKQNMGGSPGDVVASACNVGEARKGCRMSCEVGEAAGVLENGLCL